MVKKIEDLNYYELLEVSPTASSQEIYRAYERVRKVYEPNSVALYSLFTSEETASIHRQIEEAYQTLMYESHRKRYDERLKAGGHPHIEQVAPDRVTAEQALFTGSSNQTAGHNPRKESSAGDTPPQTPEPAPPFNAEFTGPAIKLLREQRNFTIRHVSEITKISGRYIELIEAEDYQKLPARPYLRGFLMLYAKALGYAPDRVVTDYLRRYETAAETQK